MRVLKVKSILSINRVCNQFVNFFRENGGICLQKSSKDLKISSMRLSFPFQQKSSLQRYGVREKVENWGKSRKCLSKIAQDNRKIETTGDWAEVLEWMVRKNRARGAEKAIIARILFIGRTTYFKLRSMVFRLSPIWRARSPLVKISP